MREMRKSLLQVASGPRQRRDGSGALEMVRDLHAGPRASTGQFTSPWWPSRWIVRLREATEAS